eukprot:COSAG05_NODE_734_length_7640_cov_9.470495_3_plen_195_part_00
MLMLRAPEIPTGVAIPLVVVHGATSARRCPRGMSCFCLAPLLDLGSSPVASALDFRRRKPIRGQVAFELLDLLLDHVDSHRRTVEETRVDRPGAQRDPSAVDVCRGPVRRVVQVLLRDAVSSFCERARTLDHLDGGRDAVLRHPARPERVRQEATEGHTRGHRGGIMRLRGSRYTLMRPAWCRPSRSWRGTVEI